MGGGSRLGARGQHAQVGSLRPRTHPQAMHWCAEALAVLAQALLAVLCVAADLDHLRLERVPVGF